MSKVEVIAVGPGATLSSGRYLFPGERATTELDDQLENHIRTGVVNVVERAEKPAKSDPPRKQQPTSTGSASDPTEGE